MKNTRLKTIVCLAVLLLAGSVTAAAQAAQQTAPAKTVDISGVWEMTLQTQRGDINTEITFTQKEGAITVTMANPMGQEMKGEGTVKENGAEWKFTVPTPDGGEFVIVFKAQIEGEKMTGEASMGEFGSSPFTAVKKK